MNEVQIFNNEEFGKVRTVRLEDGPWFVGKDVAEILGYRNPNEAIIDHVDDEDKFLRGNRGSEMLKLFNSLKEMQENFGRQDNWFINESGVYALVFGSKLPTAKKFKHWVTSDVLPTLRKTGSYVMSDVQQRIQSDPMFAAEYFAKHFLEVAKDRDKLAKQIEDEKPMTELGKGITKAVNDISIGEMAKILHQNGVDTGRTRFFQTLRDDGYLMEQDGEKNIPTQKAMNLGVLRVIEGTITLPHTNITRTTHKAMVTGKGQAYFLDKYTA